MQTNIACDCCAAPLQQAELTVNGYKWLRCRACGADKFVAHDHVVAPTEMYGDDYDYASELTLSSDYRHSLRWHHKEALRLIGRAPRSRLLDIGCFSGFFVRATLEHGFDSFGIDTNASAINAGIQKFNLSGRLSVGSISGNLFQAGKFSFVSLFETLEHLPAPATFLQDARELMTHDGTLIISVPNSNMVWRPALDSPPHHLSRFTPAAIAALVTRHGFEIIHHREEMSSFQLARNAIGSLFRNNAHSSLRGGEFRAKAVTTNLRKTANVIGPVINYAAVPIDKLLHLAGVRYISQLVIARKK